MHMMSYALFNPRDANCICKTDDTNQTAVYAIFMMWLNCKSYKYNFNQGGKNRHCPLQHESLFSFIKPLLSGGLSDAITTARFLLV